MATDFTPESVTKARDNLADAQTAVQMAQETLTGLGPKPKQAKQQKKHTEAEKVLDAAQNKEQEMKNELAAKEAEANDPANMCKYIMDHITDKGTWAWHKNRATVTSDTPIVYFTKRIEYMGAKYIALAHIHGYTDGRVMRGVTEWEYNGPPGLKKAGKASPDKLDIWPETPTPGPAAGRKPVCEKDKMGGVDTWMGRKLYDSIGAPSIAKHAVKTNWVPQPDQFPPAADYPARLYPENALHTDSSSVYSGFDFGM